jgi:hypothetical protein
MELPALEVMFPVTAVPPAGVSVKVEALKVVSFITSLNMAVTGAVTATPVFPAAGVTEITAGAVWDVVKVLPPLHPATTKAEAMSHHAPRNRMIIFSLQTFDGALPPPHFG